MSEEVAVEVTAAEVVESIPEPDSGNATDHSEGPIREAKPAPTLLGYLDGDVKLTAAVAGVIKVADGFKTDDVRFVTEAIANLDPSLARVAPLVFSGVAKAKADGRYRFVTLAEFSIRSACQLPQGWEADGQPAEVLAHVFDSWQRGIESTPQSTKANCNFVNLAALVIVERRKTWAAHSALQAAAALIDIPVIGAPKAASGAEYADLVGTRPSITSMKAALRRLAPVLATTEALGSASHEHASERENLRTELEEAEHEIARLKAELKSEQDAHRSLEQDLGDARGQLESAERRGSQALRENRQRTVALLSHAIARLAQSRDAIGLGAEGLTAATRDIAFVEKQLTEEREWLSSSE